MKRTVTRPISISRRAGRVAVWAACLACAGRFGAGAAPVVNEGPPVRLIAPAVVRWDAGAPQEVRFTVVNTSERPISLARGAGEAVSLEVFDRSRSTRLCRALAAPSDGTGGSPAALASGGELEATVELTAACGALPAGDYRYVVAFDAGDTKPGAPPLATARGDLVVAPPSDVAIPRLRGSLAPPEHAPAAARAPSGPAGTPRPALAPAGSHPQASCVDRELERLGRNAYGDPPGTLYADGPPVPPEARIDHVLRRIPDIRTACGVPAGLAR